jgi:hypothetical protein
MVGLLDVAYVTLIAIGAAVLIGVLGYFIDKSGEDRQ